MEVGKKISMNELIPLRAGPRRALSGRPKGQIIVFYLVFIIPMAMLLFSVYNVGQVAAEKMKLQNAADNAAYSAAVWEARYMNIAAYTNRAMVANYDTMAMVLAIWSMADSWDGFLDLAAEVTQFIPYVGQAISAALEVAHGGVHAFNKGMAAVVGGSKQRKALLYVMETYNKILSVSQYALYWLNQAARKSVIDSIAWGVDPKIQYLSWGEAINFFGLNSRIRYDGTDKDKGLRLTTIRSLNEFSRGESFRDVGNTPIFFRPLDIIFAPLDFICSLIGIGFGVQIGPQGYNVTDFNEVTGQIGGPGDCDGCSSDPKEQIVQDTRLYQHDFAGLDLKLCFAKLQIGHHSDDAYNIGGSKFVSGASVSASPPHYNPVSTKGPSPEDHTEAIKDNGIDCQKFSAPVPSGLSGSMTDNCNNALPETCGFTQFPGDLLAATQMNGSQLQGFCEQKMNEKFCDTTNKPNDVSTSTWCADPSHRNDPSDRQERLDFANQCGQAYSGALPSGPATTGSASGSSNNPCQTVYDFETPLQDMNVTTFARDTGIAENLDGRRVQGPTVFVYFRRQAKDMPLFVGGLFPSAPTIEAYSFAKVYYTQRVGDTNNPTGDPQKRMESNKESIFNPFWAARLELPRPFGTGILLH